MKKTFLGIMLIMTILIFLQCSKSTGPVLGTVNQKEVTLGDFKNTLVNEYGFKENKLVDSDVKSLFRDFYSEYIFFEEGKAAGYYNKPEVKARVEKYEKNILIGQINQILWEKEIQPKIQVEDADLTPYRKKWQVRHILITTEKRKPEEALKIAEQVKKKLETGLSFADLAKKYSEDPGSKDKGGELGWIDYSSPFVENFRQAVFQGEKGKVLGPVKTEYGYHIILIDNQKEVGLEEIRKDQKILDQLQKQKAQKIAEGYMIDLRKKYEGKIHYYPERILQPAKFKGQDFYRVDGVNSMTVDQIVQIMGPQFSYYQKNLESFKDDMQKKLIDPALRYLDAVEKGYDKDPVLQKRRKFEIIKFKGNIYENELRSQFRAQAEKKITEEEMKKFYEENKATYYTNKEGKPIPYDKVKNWVKRDILAQKDQSYIANLKSQLFKKYRVEFKG